MTSAERLTVLFNTLAVTVGVSLVMILFGVFLRYRNIRRTRRWQGLESAWEAMLLSVLVGDATPAALYARVARDQPLRFLNYLARFARRVSGPEREALRSLATPYLELLEPRVYSAKPERRAWALQTLGLFGDWRFEQLFVAALKDEDAGVAFVAAAALARPEYAQHVRAVLQQLERFSNWSLRSIAPMLAAFGNAATPALREVFADETRAGWVRATAGNALYMLRDFASADIAASVVLNHTDRDLTLAALQLLGEYGDDRHVESVRQLVAHEDFVIRAQAVETLAMMGERNDLLLVQSALADENAWVALRAAHALLRAHALPLLSETASAEDRAGVIAREALSVGEA